MPPGEVSLQGANSASKINLPTEAPSRFSKAKEKVVSALKSVFGPRMSAVKALGSRSVQIGKPADTSPVTTAKSISKPTLQPPTTFDPALLPTQLGLTALPKSVQTGKDLEAAMGEMRNVLLSNASPTEKKTALLKNAAPALNKALQSSDIPYATKLSLTLGDGKPVLDDLKAAFAKDLVEGKQEWFEKEWASLFTPGFSKEFFHKSAVNLGDSAEGPFNTSSLEGTSITVDGKKYSFAKKLGSGEFGVAALYVDPTKKNSAVVVKIPIGETADVLIDGPANEAKGQLRLMGTGGAAEHAVALKGAIRTDDGKLLLVSNFAERGSMDGLKEKLKRLVNGGKVDAATASKYQLGILRDVGAMIKRSGQVKGMQHFDVALRNILVSKTGDGMLADFGMWKELEGSGPADGKAEAYKGGNIPVRWTSPERLKGQQPTAASDVWSFGMTLLEMATGQDPFHEMDLMDVGRMVISPNWNPDQALPQISEKDWPNGQAKQIRELLVKILQQDPDKRPTMDEILNDPLFTGLGGEAVKNKVHKELGEVSTLPAPAPQLPGAYSKSPVSTKFGDPVDPADAAPRSVAQRIQSNYDQYGVVIPVADPDAPKTGYYGPVPDQDPDENPGLNSNYIQV